MVITGTYFLTLNNMKTNENILEELTGKTITYLRGNFVTVDIALKAIYDAQEQIKSYNAPHDDCPTLFGIYNNTRIVLGFIDRIRALFGKEMRVDIDITISKEVAVLNTEVKTTVAPFFKPKPNKNNGAMSVNKNEIGSAT